MADTHVLTPRRTESVRERAAGAAVLDDHRRAVYPAYKLLHIAFIVVPIVAGVDKFFHVLTNWDMYLSSAVERMLPFSGHAFMLGVGVIEVVAGLLVAFKPRIGGFVVAAWLLGITINLLLPPGWYDIALRDLG
ncbi:MAG TPA: hypothetical protein VEJ18_06825, partial [Planctomycetota bacterium]|nr:hypothetical protein [Planctomycetota bacterium]